MKSLMFAVIAVVIIYAAGFGLGQNGIWILPVSGLFIAVMWPTMMAVAMKVFGGDAPIVTSAIITVSGAINGIFQMVIGLTNQYAGEAWGYRSCLIYALVVLMMLYVLLRNVKKKSIAV
jgi:fucose permease